MKKIFAALCLLATVGCTPPHPLLGEQNLEGFLEPASISAVRRGTHVLRQNGEETVFVESSTLALRNFENQEVQVEGLVEENTNPDALPVLVATTVKRVGKSELTDWEFPNYNITLQTPTMWNMLRNGEEIQFFLAGHSTPIMYISSDALTPSEAEPFSIQDRLAEYAQSDNAEYLTIYSSPKIVMSYVGGPDWKQAWDETRASISFTNELVTPTVTPTAGSNQPCGGIAGVLCPDGEWCQVLSEDGVGKCRSL